MCCIAPPAHVMAGLVPAIHVFERAQDSDVDANATRACSGCAALSGASRASPTCADERGHDGGETCNPLTPTLSPNGEREHTECAARGVRQRKRGMMVERPSEW